MAEQHIWVAGKDHIRTNNEAEILNNVSRDLVERANQVRSQLTSETHQKLSALINSRLRQYEADRRRKQIDLFLYFVGNQLPPADDKETRSNLAYLWAVRDTEQHYLRNLEFLVETTKFLYDEFQENQNIYRSTDQPQNIKDAALYASKIAISKYLAYQKELENQIHQACEKFGIEFLYYKDNDTISQMQRQQNQNAMEAALILNTVDRAIPMIKSYSWWIFGTLGAILLVGVLIAIIYVVFFYNPSSEDELATTQ